MFRKFLALAISFTFPCLVQAQPVAMPALASCDVRGAKIWDPNKNTLNDLLLDSAGPRIFGVTLAEKKSSENSTYLTNTHLEVSLEEAEGKWALQTEARSSHGKATAVVQDLEDPLRNLIRITSRVNGPEMELEVQCRLIQASYVFLPVYYFNTSPLYGTHFLPATVSNLLLNSGRFTHSQSPSIAEYLADNYCLAGSAEAAMAEMSKVTDASSRFWRTDAVSRSVVLAPVALEVNAEGGISWRQRVQRIDCMISHEETYFDHDTGREETRTVCDKYIKSERPSLPITIPACS